LPNRYRFLIFNIFHDVMRKTLTGVVTIFILLSCSREQQHPDHTLGIECYREAEDLYSFTEELRKKHDLPALGIGIIHEGKIIGLGMAGERKEGSEDWAKADDLFDFASCVKSMTATVAAMLVEKGKLQWNTTIGDVFPELANTMRSEYRAVTLEMLLAHRSGLDSWMGSQETWSGWYDQHGSQTPTDQRYLFTKKVLQDVPLYAPGTKHHYCNDGYLVVASMIEKIAGEPWEEVIHDQLFIPLKLDASYAGSPDSSQHTRIVWGHEEGFLSTKKEINPLDERINPSFGTGSGKLFASIPDMLKYLSFHIKGEVGQQDVLLRETFLKLHTPLPEQNYALGWDVESVRNKDGKIVERSIFHGGFNGRTRSNIWFSPESQYGTVIVYNYASGEAIDAYQDIFYALLRKYQLIK
jgi:CubicO group peptidase (beta-lactamase class C family)